MSQLPKSAESQADREYRRERFTGYDKLSDHVFAGRALSVAKSNFGKCAELNELYMDPPELLELFLNFSYQLP
jgi:hypothetical protein